MQSEEQVHIKANSKRMQKAVKLRMDALAGVKGKAKSAAATTPAWLKVIQGGAMPE